MCWCESGSCQEDTKDPHGANRRRRSVHEAVLQQFKMCLRVARHPGQDEESAGPPHLFLLLQF